MNISELEEKWNGLREQHMEAVATASRIAKEHGLTLAQSYLMPKFDPEILEDDPKLQAIDAERSNKMKSLPPDVRASQARALELNDLVCEVQTDLIQARFQQGLSVEQIAEWLGLDEDTVSASLSIGDA